MNLTTRKRTARVKLTLNKRTVDSLLPAAKPWIAWDDKLTGFGVRVQPSGTKAYVVNFRTGSGGRKAPNRRVVIGRYGAVAPDQARRLAQELLGRVAVGGDPARERAARRRLPTLAEAFDEYLAANPGRKRSTETLYRGQMRYCLGDWLSRPLDAISRQDVEARFNQVSARHGWAVGNHAISLLRSVYRRPCVDFEALRNPVELWLAGGGRYHRPVRRRISTPAEVLPRWRAGIESEVVVPATRDIFWFGMYTGMRRGEITALRWDRVDLERRVLRIEETKTGEPLELPITDQLGALFARRGGAGVGGDGAARNGAGPGRNGAGRNGAGRNGAGRNGAGRGGEGAGPPSAGWVFPSTSASGHVEAGAVRRRLRERGREGDDGFRRRHRRVSDPVFRFPMRQDLGRTASSTEVGVMATAIRRERLRSGRRVRFRGRLAAALLVVPALAGWFPEGHNLPRDHRQTPERAARQPPSRISTRAWFLRRKGLMNRTP